jgi:DNA-binding response OmpR family regulator
MRILVAEDEPGLRDVIVLGLVDAGYQVDAVDRGDDAIDQLKWYEYDVAVLDWRMPGAEGIEVVRWARSHERPTAILMLTARDTTADRVEGLDSGADDYLVKPFEFGELLARIRALQRRPRGVDAPIIKLGRLTLDPARRVVTSAGREVTLTPTEYLVLEVLMRRAPGVVDRAQDAFGGYDSACIRTGIHGDGDILTATADDLDVQYAGNMRSVFYALQALLTPLVEQGSGQVVINTSWGGLRVEDGYPTTEDGYEKLVQTPDIIEL